MPAAVPHWPAETAPAAWPDAVAVAGDQRIIAVFAAVALVGAMPGIGLAPLHSCLHGRSAIPAYATLLKIYALYKQGSSGDNADKKPGFGDMVARAKWDAWNSLKGTSQEDAMQQYVDLIELLS